MLYLQVSTQIFEILAAIPKGIETAIKAKRHQKTLGHGLDSAMKPPKTGAATAEARSQTSSTVYALPLMKEIEVHDETGC